MAKRPYYIERQLMDAMLYLETGRTQKALRVVQTTLDVLHGHRPMEDQTEEGYTGPTVACRG
jgi:hypothetical protein